MASGLLDQDVNLLLVVPLVRCLLLLILLVDFRFDRVMELQSSKFVLYSLDHDFGNHVQFVVAHVLLFLLHQLPEFVVLVAARELAGLDLLLLYLTAR